MAQEVLCTNRIHPDSERVLRICVRGWMYIIYILCSDPDSAL